MKKKNIILLVIVIILLISGAYFLFLKGNGNTTFTLETVKVARGDIANMVTATGTVEAITQVEVGTQVSGIVSHIYVDYNSIVTKGQLIAELDRTLLEAELASSTATLNAAKVEYDYQTRNFDRQKQLYDKKLISDTEFETAKYQFETAKSNYEKSKADLVKATTNLNYARIYSPIDGVVISRAVDEGQTVAASFSTPTLFTIANDLRKMQVVADVDEADIGEITEGQRVSFTVDAFPNDVFTGDITQVRLEPTTTPNLVTYEVIVNAPNPDLKLKPGLTANITIYTSERKNVINIPLKALRFVPELPSGKTQHMLSQEKLTVENDSSKIVWVKENSSLSPRKIITGMDNGINIEVKSGLEEGEEVITDRKAGVSTVQETDKQQEESPFMPKPPGKK